MKELRIVDIFPTAYRLNHSDQRFAKIRQKWPLPLVVRKEFHRNRKEFQKYFNVWKLRPVRSFPTGYETVAKIWIFLKNRIPQFSKFETALKP